MFTCTSYIIGELLKIPSINITKVLNHHQISSKYNLASIHQRKMTADMELSTAKMENKHEKKLYTCSVHHLV